MIVEALTDIGLSRKENEDFYCCDKEKGLFVIADGMGGHAGGEVASATAVRVVSDHFNGVTEESYKEVFSALFSLANNEIYCMGQEKKHLRGMGTTLIALAVKDDCAYIAHVGDSRVYRLQNKGLQQLTEDQNIAGQLLREGQITEEEAMEHPGQSMLTNVIGTDPEFDIDFMSVPFVKNDIFLLCTDGLIGCVKAEEIEKCLNQHKDLQKAAKKLLQMALQQGGDDNITVILIKNA